MEAAAREELRKRLSASNQPAQEAETASAPAPEPEPELEPQSDPAPEPSAPEPDGAPTVEPPPVSEPAPAAPPVPAVDPAQVESTQRENALLRAKLDQLQPEVEDYRRLEQERGALNIQLPTAEELAENPAKAMERYHRDMTEATARRFAALQGSVQKIGQDVWGVAKSSAEAEVLRRYPGVDMEKYRPSFERTMARNPDLNAVEAIKVVADPADLIAKKETAPMTPKPRSAAVPRSGRAVRTGASTRKSKEPTSQDYLAAAETARQAGDERGRKTAMSAAIEARLGETNKKIQ